jgi:hypothetical protein
MKDNKVDECKLEIAKHQTVLELDDNMKWHKEQQQQEAGSSSGGKSIFKGFLKWKKLIYFPLLFFS